MNEEVSFIHLSDIHFNKNSGDVYDLDEDLRNEIILDIENKAKSKIGKVAGVLICGDIAFSGKAKEYNTALEFLNNVCAVLGIPETSVFCVPGNHDVDQEITRTSPILFDTQSNIEKSEDSDYMIAKYSRDKISKDMLYNHIEEYNKFAAKFRCNINDNSPTWKESIKLTENYTLQINGLNSVIISNHEDDESKLMVLGQHQVPQRCSGVIQMTLCHHPPGCWKDNNDTIKNKMDERVHIQLYGHKHMQHIEMKNNSLSIGSGATHPVRWEKDWIPRYNWIKLCIGNKDNEQFLKIRVYPRILNPTETAFIADFNECKTNDFKEYTIKLCDLGKNAYSDATLADIYTEPESEENRIDEEDIVLPNLRQLVYRFLTISFIQRSNILNKLSLLEEADEGVEHNILIDTILQRANERGILEDLFIEINKQYNK